MEETYNFLPDERDISRKHVDLEDYFEKKSSESGSMINSTKADLNNKYMEILQFLKQQKNYCTHLNFNAHTGCYQIKIKGKVIDFPANWSIFLKYQHLRHNQYINLSAANDTDDLNNVLEILLGPSVDIILIKVKDADLMVAVNSFQTDHLVNFLEDLFQKDDDSELLRKA